MLYGQITESSVINDFIYRCFEDLSKVDQRKFVKKFSEQPHAQTQVMHTLAELTCGAYLSSRGYRIAYDYNLNGQTPDWCILNVADSPLAIIEVVNIRIDHTTEQYIEQQKKAKGYAVYRRDENAKNENRLFENIKQKAVSYRELVNRLALPYIIAVRPDFRTFIDLAEVRDCLISNDYGLFDLYVHVSGVMYFEENRGRYDFRYIINPNCLRTITLPEGYYPWQEKFLFWSLCGSGEPWCISILSRRSWHRCLPCASGRLQSQTQEELDALLPSILAKTFKGEL